MTKEEFDDIIRENLAAVYGKDCFGYDISSVIYENYYSRDAFKRFKDEMNSSRYKEFCRSYIEGKGGELKEHSGRWGRVPPKMASVASSSRFCYLALRDGATALGGGAVEFEVAQKITGIRGIAPQLDARIKDKNVFVEAKCHEIFDSYKMRFPDSYKRLILGKNNQFGFEFETESADGRFELPLSLFGVDNPMFDIKQLICHLMGIASNKNEGEQAELIYMFFKPKTDNDAINHKIDGIFEKLKSEITKIFKSKPIGNFISNNGISLRAIAEYDYTMKALSKDNMIVLVTA